MDALHWNHSVISYHSSMGFFFMFRSRLLCTPISNCKTTTFFSQPLSLITEWVNSKWNVINHDTNRRPNCMWSILSCAYFFCKSVVSHHYGYDDINFPFHQYECNFIFYLSVCLLLLLLVFFLSNFCFCLVFGFGLKWHNHSKPQIKRNSKRKRHEGKKNK